MDGSESFWNPSYQNHAREKCKKRKDFPKYGRFLCTCEYVQFRGIHSSSDSSPIQIQCPGNVQLGDLRQLDPSHQGDGHCKCIQIQIQIHDVKPRRHITMNLVQIYGVHSSFPKKIQIQGRRSKAIWAVPKYVWNNIYKVVPFPWKP